MMILTTSAFSAGETSASTGEKSRRRGGSAAATDPHRRPVDFEPKLMAGALVMSFIFLPILIFSISSLLAVSRFQDRLNSKFAQAAVLSEKLRSQKVEQNGLMPVFVLSGDPTLIRRLHAADEHFDATLATLSRMGLPTEQQRLLTLIRGRQSQLRALEPIGVKMKQAGAPVAVVDAYFRRAAGPTTQAVDRQLNMLVVQSAQLYAEERTKTHGLVVKLIKTLVAATCVAGLLCLTVAGLLVRLIRSQRQRDELHKVLSQRERAISEARREAIETVGHDLRNPLTAILLATDILVEGTDSARSKRTRSTLDTLYFAAQSMNQLIENILDHTKIETGQLIVSTAPGDIACLLCKLAARFELIAQRKGVTLINDLASPLPTVFIEESRIEQVFCNLLGNSMKFTPAGGAVRLSAHVREGALEIAVSDSGVGMTAVQVEKAFEKYWQAGETASKGVGLGLAISKAVVEAHQGTLRVESHLGVGSTFIVSLPTERLADPRSAMIDAAPSPTGSPSPRQGRWRTGRRPSDRRNPPGRPRWFRPCVGL